MSEDPDRAMEWASKIVDPGERETALVSTAIFWRKRDMAAADAWLDASDLSEEAKERVRNPPTPVKPQRPDAAAAAKSDDATDEAPAESEDAKDEAPAESEDAKDETPAAS